MNFDWKPILISWELLTTVLFYPVELVKSRLQASANSFASSSYQYSGLADGLLTILQKNGPQGLFVGIGPVLVRAGSSDFVAAYAGEALLQRFSLPSLGFLQGLFWRTLGCGVSVLSTMPFESVAARSILAATAGSVQLHTPHATRWLGGWGRHDPRPKPHALAPMACAAREAGDQLDRGPGHLRRGRAGGVPAGSATKPCLPYELPSTSRSRFAGAAYPAYPVYAPQHPPRGHVALTAAGGDKLLELQLLQAEAAQKKQALEEKRAQASQSVMLASKHTTALLIGAVMVGILLVFALCMASSLGLGARGEAAYMKRRLSTSDWVVALVMGSILVMLQLYAFHHIGLLSLPTGDYAFPLMVCCVAVSFFSPVLFVSWLHCFTSFEHLDDELDHVSKRFDRLERLVSAGFHKSLQEEQELLRSTSYDKFKYKEVFLMENPFLGQMGVRRMDCCQTSGTTGYPGRQHGTYGSGGTISTPHDRMPPNGGGSSGVVSAVPESGLEECMNESLRNVELPVLPLDANSLTFGDWLVTIEPLAARQRGVTTSFPPLSSRGAMQVLWKEGGAYSFWRGLRVNLVLCLNPGLTFTALAQIKNLLLSLSRRQSLSTLEAAFAGVLAKLLALLLSYPLMRGKSLVQARLKRARDTGTGVLHVLRHVARDEGARSLYQASKERLPCNPFIDLSPKRMPREAEEPLHRRMARNPFTGFIQHSVCGGADRPLLRTLTPDVVRDERAGELYRRDVEMKKNLVEPASDKQRDDFQGF
eukprot:g11601.t1